jgi:hypothetical protein
VLRTEDANLYTKIRAHFMACFRPEDVIQWWLVNRLVDNAWLIKRYSCHQTVAVERWYQQSLQFQAQRKKHQNDLKDKRTSFQADRMSQTPPEVAQLRHLEDTILESISDVEEILERTPTELEHNRALEKGITFHEQLDKLTTNATKRFNDTLVLLEHYNAVMGPRLRQAAQELFAPNCGQSAENPRPQTEATSIVPAELALSPEGDGTVDPKPDQPSPRIASDQTVNLAADQASPPTLADQAAGPDVEQTPPAAPTRPSTEANQAPV